MILKEISDSSIVVSSFRYCSSWYSQLGQRSNYIYHNSQTHRLTTRFWEKIKISFRYSFLGRITETKQTTPVVLDNSRVMQFLIGFYKRWKDKIIYYLNTSSTVDLAKDIKKELYFSPVMIISIIVATAIVINVFLSIVLQKPIGLWGWFLRGLFFLGAVSGLFCKADWPTVKRNSVFLRKM